MTCDSVGRLIPLYFYGELMPEEEDRLEEHLHACAGCTREMERQRAMAAALDRRRRGGSAHAARRPAAPICWLPSRAAHRAARNRPKAPGRCFWKPWQPRSRGFNRYRTPVGAVALVAVGFFAARFTGAGVPASSLSPAGEVFSTVRSVEPDSSGRVQIAFDETRRRVVSGPTGDRDIQRLLLAAAREDNPAVRVESVDLLRSRAGSGEVRNALLNAVAHDSNAGVRLKALDGLKPLADDPQVRQTLAQVLLADDNPAVRMQVVDLLVSRRDDSTVGVLQNLVQKEDNNYVRLKCEKALKDMNASIGTF